MGCGNVESLERVQQATGVDRFHYLWAGLMKREQGTKRFRTIFVFLREDFDFCEQDISPVFLLWSRGAAYHYTSRGSVTWLFPTTRTTTVVDNAHSYVVFTSTRQ